MKIVGIIVTIFFILLTYCSCKVSAWADEEMERERNEKKNLQSNNKQ